MKILKSPNQESTSLTERVYQHLRVSVITGKIPAGTRLVESNLAADMKVSRTPVREALHKLALEGLLYSIPRAGYIVEAMSDHDIQDLFTTRTAIELLAAKWALEKITPPEIERLAQNIQKTEAAIEDRKTDRMMDLDTEFHQIIYKACRSKSLYQICQSLSDHTLKYRLACIHIPEIAQRARDGHKKIYLAFRDQNAGALEQAIQGHLNIVRNDILEYLNVARQESLVAE